MAGLVSLHVSLHTVIWNLVTLLIINGKTTKATENNSYPINWSIGQVILVLFLVTLYSVSIIFARHMVDKYLVTIYPIK